MSELCYLGIDTSCYTTSLALVDAEGRLLSDLRQLLPVAAGQRGLRQSDAIFHHVRQLPALLQQVPLAGGRLAAVGVSDRPRPQADSYMPVFLAGVAVGEAMATGASVPLWRFSHQEGHIAAGLGWPGVTEAQQPFLAIHLSGGTSEVLRVTPQAEAGFAVELLAGTADLSAGQMVDRVGVALGLPFPAGPELERLARQASGRISLPSVVNAEGFSFSGPCSAAMRLVEQGADAAEIAFATLRVIANSLEKVLRQITETEGLQTVLLVGGVMSNQLIRQRLQHRLGSVLSLHFVAPQFCTDNAVGIAWLTREKFGRQ